MPSRPSAALSCACLFLLLSCLATVPARAAALQKRPAVKVMIIAMFGPEADVWRPVLGQVDSIAVPGLSADFPAVACNRQNICLLTTGMGHANAAASVSALVLSRRFDLSRTYFLIAGIAGIAPAAGTIGSAAWARFLVDFGIQHEIDPREAPTDWPSGYFGIETAGPDAKPDLAYRTEVFKLDEDLLQWALALSEGAVLADNDQAKAYRAHYAEAPARAAPKVIQCDTAGGDTYWHGRILGERAEAWTKILTDGQGRYCTTQQEDNASFEALKRGAAAGLVDIGRVAVLRSGANFDRPYPGQSAYQSLKASSGGFQPALANLAIAGRPLVDEIVGHWDRWKKGVPKR